mgnify:CR=1 FL=1
MGVGLGFLEISSLSPTPLIATFSTRRAIYLRRSLAPVLVLKPFLFSIFCPIITLGINTIPRCDEFGHWLRDLT